MNEVMRYCKPVFIDLSGVIEVIRSTVIRGQRGTIGAIYWRITPAYNAVDR